MIIIFVFFSNTNFNKLINSVSIQNKKELNIYFNFLNSPSLKPCISWFDAQDAVLTDRSFLEHAVAATKQRGIPILLGLGIIIIQHGVKSITERARGKHQNVPA